MTQTEHNILVEQFNLEYPNHGKLEIKLLTPGSPAKELKSVKHFTDDEKALYMKDILFVRHYASVKRAGRKGECPLLDPMDDTFEVPASVSRAYLASLA